MCKRMKSEPYFTPYTKINSMWIKDQNLRAKTIKLSGENIGEYLHNLVVLGIIPKAKAIKEK